MKRVALSALAVAMVFSVSCARSPDNQSGHDVSQPLSRTNCHRPSDDDLHLEGSFMRDFVIVPAADLDRVQRDTNVEGLPVAHRPELIPPVRLGVYANIVDAVEELSAEDGYVALAFLAPTANAPIDMARDIGTSQLAFRVDDGDVYSLLPNFTCMDVGELYSLRRLLPAEPEYNDGLAGLFDAIAARDESAMAIMDPSRERELRNQKRLEQ